MKKLRLLLLAVLLTCLCFSSCNKKDKKQYSTWYVNGDKFSSNDVGLDIGNGMIALGNGETDYDNNFEIAFNFGNHLPVNGSFPLAKVPTNNPAIVDIGFYYHSLWYIPSMFENSELEASEVDGKARYALPPTWFVNYYDHNDSVLIHGVFNEP